MKKMVKLLASASLALTIAAPAIPAPSAEAASSGEVVINEIAWMGTTANYNDEWVELYNNTSSAVSLDGWNLASTDGTPSIPLTGTIPANGYYLLERTDDSTVSEVSANEIYSGAMGNTGEVLELRDSGGALIDNVDAWHSGDNDTKATMERIDSNGSGTDASNWGTSTGSYTEGIGTPGVTNSQGSAPASACTDTTEHLNQVSNAPDAINVYFNKCALDQYASPGNEANYNVNLENRLLNRINGATSSIDFATYEINLPKVVDALITKAAEGVDVRVIADAKDATDPHYIERFELMRLYVEEMVRGKDMVIGTADDITILSDSPMLAVEDQAKRADHGLPSSPDDFPQKTIMVGNTEMTGYLFVDAEQQSDGTYYSPGTQMHNKFAVIDDKWVFTGSWNFTVTGLYGSDENMQNGVLDGNQQHVVEVNSSELAGIYETEFNEMWGSNTLTPNIQNADFSSRKTDNTVHELTIGGKQMEVYFSPGDNAVDHMAELVKLEADLNTYFTIFAWSDQALVDELKNKWEGSYTDQQGTLTGFDVKGVFDSSFWNQWWSASIEMTGQTVTGSTNNPNTRWANAAPVYKDAESRKLHSKTMIIDADTNSDPTVIVGSTNWSTNGNDINDENMLIIHDTNITNQFVQEFNARYTQAGGTVQ
ncbi:phospholipase D-like domain-containing protein [Pseudalkalibacillus hwajinpoensis]|uniref:phospholipase D n=1 Tax=Guptibacillus hwajinpoensis TaxID=208199 RepID=A0A4U1MN34_9BACL|nr:phospholipase D-like domain-containing protein [Pseudalkalibacillus hwajinpoensis]TKD72085.1 competence protein ComEA [Pseudalkalibacillus hwajinpoensis]